MSEANALPTQDSQIESLQRALADTERELAEARRERDGMRTSVDARHKLLSAVTLERDTLQRQNAELLLVLRHCDDLLTVVPMSFPYNDRAHELRKQIDLAMREGGETA